jgi:hypothetical protein
MKMVWAFAVVFLAALLISDRGLTEQLTVGENLRHEQIKLPPAIPERSQMVVVDSTTFVYDNGASGILLFYDDARTKREVDYIEFYDLEGNLLLVSWIDRFGVCQVAMDRGLLDADEPEVDGTLVLIGVGREL